MQPFFYNLTDLVALTGLAKSTIYRRIQDGTIPAPTKVGHRSLWRRETLLDALKRLEIETDANRT